MMLRRTVLVLLLLLVVGWTLALSPPASAHGGVVIQTGTIEDYEYLVQVYPYPLQPGVAVLSLFLFDYQAGGPALGFAGEVYLAPPGDTTPCCQPGVHSGPFRLYADPVMYPGDYTAYLPLDLTGEWQAQFRVRAADGAATIELVTPLPVESFLGQVIDPAAIATQAAVMGVVAEDMAQNSFGQSPMAPSSPLAGPMPLAGISPLTMTMASPLAAPLGGAAAGLAAGPSEFTAWTWWGMATIVVAGAVFSVWHVRRQE